jgi:hypothetical protein
MPITTLHGAVLGLEVDLVQRLMESEHTQS